MTYSLNVGAGLIWFFVGGMFASLVAFGSSRKREGALNTDIAKLVEENRQNQNRVNELSDRLEAAQAQGKASEEKASDEREARARLDGQIGELLPLKAHVFELEQKVSALDKSNSQLIQALKNERENSEEKLRLLQDAKTELSNQFSALSAQALKSNSSTFLDLAKEVLEKQHMAAKGELLQRQSSIDETVKPIRETLGKFESKLGELEHARTSAYSEITTQVKGLLDVQNLLRIEAQNLVKALATPRIRGRWGEMQLKRVVELAGMLNHCDFVEQQTVSTEDGKVRPDLIVKLPGGRNIVVDSKAPLAAFLEALETTDEPSRLLKMRDHARQFRDHVASLSKKAYWEQFEPAPDYVIMFVPGEHFYNAALEHDPNLLEHGIENRVLIATPASLISLLKAASYGWRQQAIAENAQVISDLGKELHKRVSDMAEHFRDVGSKLGRAVESYNKTSRSLEARVLVSTRKFVELKAAPSDQAIEVLEEIEIKPLELTATKV